MNNSLVFVISLSFLFPAQIFAASVFFESKDNQFSAGQDFLVEFVLDSENESLNAISGKIVFDPNILDLKEIRDGNSVINFWVEKPAIDKSGSINFSGITPGGLSTGSNLIFALVFHAEKKGSSFISFNEMEAFKNDGNGSKAQVKKAAFDFSIDNKPIPDAVNLFDATDTDPPEDFRPNIGKDPEMFDGKYFAVFTTQDKGVGIDHYEIKEGFWGKYQKGTSPYLLQNQSLNKKIYIKAVDKALNERVVGFKPDNNKNWYKQYYLLGIIVMAILIVGFLFKNKWKRIFTN